MRRFNFNVCWLAFLVVLAGNTCPAAETNAPSFSDVYDLVRAQLRGLTAAELDRAAVDGLLSALGPRVALVTNGAAKPVAGPLVTRTEVLEDNVAYVRVGTVSPGLAQAIAQSHGDLSRTSNVVGLVLDLRFAGGDDYAAAAETAGLFLKSEMALLDWGDGAAKVKPAAKGISGAVTVLVNRQTVGASEALAAAVREAGAGLILGTPTVGMAALKQEFPLRSGHTLLIATTPVKLANGTALSPQGVKPDIEISVPAEEEKACFADPYRETAKPAELALTSESSVATNAAAVTNRSARRLRPSEADLVRLRREGVPLDGELITGRAPEPDRPILRDRVLSRAVDLLKGLAVVRPAHN
jgi:hypothetical protein